MARSLHETYHVQRPDFIPEGQEYKYPSQGGIFCDFIPAGSNCDEVRPIEPVAEVSTEDIPPHIEEVESWTELIEVEKKAKGKKNV